MKALLNASIAIFAATLLSVLSGCSGGVTQTGNPPQVYITTGSAGAFSKWQISHDSSSALNAETAFLVDWAIPNPSDGSTLFSYKIAGGCQSRVYFGFRECTVTAVSCANGTIACPSSTPAAGETFYLMEMPGVAIMTYTPAENEFHSGVLLGDCSSSVAGDYVNLTTGIGALSLFDVFRSDSSFTNFVSAAFGLFNPGAPTLYYATTDGGGTGTSTAPAASCQDGIRTFNANGFTLHATATASGMMVINSPQTTGGLIGFRKELAAGLSDLQNKSLYGFAFLDDAPATLAQLSTGTAAGNRVPYISLVYSAGAQPSITGQYIESVKTIGSAFNFNGNPPGPSSTSYATNLLQPTYPTPGDFPGLFVNPVGTSVNDGVVLSAMKSASGKVAVFGTRYDNRGGVIKVTGNYLFFEQ